MSEDTKQPVDSGSVASQGYPPLDHVGVHFSLEREIVREEVTYTSSIWCEWTDGKHECCEVWKHESKHVISVREALELAAKDGWIVVCGRPVCGCHVDDPDDIDISDLSDMRKHFGW